MRQIKASDVKPGMTVKFDMDGWRVEGVVSRVEPVIFGLEFYSTQGVEMTLGVLTQVTVLSEPQPEEPTAFGEKVVVAGERALCIAQGLWLTDGLERCTWDDLCSLGPVTVIPDQGWTVPDDTPEVPDRIEEWPEDDEHLRAYKWLDFGGFLWLYGGDGEWRFVNRSGIPSYPHPRPCDGPWTRVTDGTPEVPEVPEVPDRVDEWPEDDTALRPYEWRDDDGYIWRYESKNHGEGWTSGHFLRGRPLCGPWTRVTDA